MIISHYDGKPIATYRDLMYAMALRARELANMSMDMLRASYPETTETRAQLVRYCKESGFTKGQIIEAILVEDFDLDFDVEFANE